MKRVLYNIGLCLVLATAFAVYFCTSETPCAGTNHGQWTPVLSMENKIDEARAQSLLFSGSTDEIAREREAVVTWADPIGGEEDRTLQSLPSDERLYSIDMERLYSINEDNR
jgi:hypothetical protein